MSSEKRSWWVSELDSLGLKANHLNEFNDVVELKNLTENIKQTFFQDYITYCNT